MASVFLMSLSRNSFCNLYYFLFSIYHNQAGNFICTTFLVSHLPLVSSFLRI
uniref:Uncharacterized protein n=1 Tax=Arundo donax TaxID=35708 RepID=A0A0A9FUI6_ARUDO